MKNIKFLLYGIALLVNLFAVSNISAQTSTPCAVKSLQITVSQSGGFAGISRAEVLDNNGNITVSNRAVKNTKKVSEKDLAEIRDMVNSLNLESAKLKTVKGAHIYDGIYNIFSIGLDGKLYLIEGTDFEDQQFVDLTAEQKQIADKIRARIEEISGKVSEKVVD